MELKALFVATRRMIDEKIDGARGERIALAVMVDELFGKARVRVCTRDDARRLVEADARVERGVRTRVAAYLTNASLEEMPVVLVSGTAVRAQMIVKTVRRTFASLGFDVEEEKKKGAFLVATLAIKPDEREQAWLDRYAAWATKNPAHPYAARHRETRWEVDIGWLLTWTLQLHQRVEVPARKAAELMATSTGDDPDAMTCRPWDAYTIEISDELIGVPFDEGIVRFGIVSVWYRRDTGETLIVARSRTMDRTIIGPRRFPLPPLNMDDVDPSKKATERAIDCIAALTVGTELTMSSPANVKKPAVKKSKKGVAGPPGTSGVHRIIAPVTIDCREHIADYVAGKITTAPKTRTFVCGFWKRVVHGVGRTLREWRQFPPSWRNLNAERVAVRPHRVKDESS